MKKFTRTQVAIVATLSLVIPFLGWVGLVKMGHLGTPGEPIAPPFNLSDRISTIEVNTSEEGERTARFHGWKPGAPELTGDAFLEEIARRREALPWIYSFLDVTSVTGVLWVAFGFAGQAVFMGRMVAQWRASEKAKCSVVPPIFWWLSLLGSSMLMVYFLWRKEIVGFLGQSTGWFIYIRNLWFIYGKANR